MIAKDLTAAADRKPSPCRVCEALGKMSKSDRALVEEALSAPSGNRLSSASLARVLTKNGHPVSESSISRCRRDHGSRR